MQTDVFAHEAMVTDAALAAKHDDGTLDPDEHLAAIDERTAHKVELRFARELTPDELTRITDAAFIEHDLLEQERTAVPHVVHEEPTIGSDGARVQATMHCPDCDKGLSSRGFDMTCSTIRPQLRACHPQCIVACGRPR